MFFNSLSGSNCKNYFKSRNAILVSLTNCIISIFAGFVVFAYMGHLAYLTGKNIETIVQAGKQGLSIQTEKSLREFGNLFFI